MKLTFLGTGTSHGVPVIGCKCRVCTSKDPKNRRTRCSSYITSSDGTAILIDVSPEFRLQALENKIKKIDCVLITHSHADHLHGIDDLRIFSSEKACTDSDANSKKAKEFKNPPIPVYTNKKTADDIKVRFSYIFEPAKEGGGHAKIKLLNAEKTFDYKDVQITPVPLQHGHTECTGWLLCEKNRPRKKYIAYLTDCNHISESSYCLIHDTVKDGTLEHLIIDGLRIKPHSTHFSFLEAMEAADKIQSKHVWFIHLTHSSSHNDVIKYINQNLKKFPNLQKAATVLPAYDELSIKV